MSQLHTPGTDIKLPTRSEAVIFRLKSFLLKGRRRLEDIFSSRVRAFPRSDTLLADPVIAESKTALWTETEPEERFLVAGKIQNLRLALAAIDGVEVPGGEVFSFWKHIGRATRRRGFVAGREIREGCIIPNVGGGLCQLSNSLYDAALKANFEIVERHAHTQVVPGSLAEQGRDATVFWNYVDLRFRSSRGFRIEVRMDHDDLTVRFRGTRIATPTLHRIGRVAAQTATHANSCATCGMDDCFRVVKPAASKDFGRTAFLVDELVPEFDDYIQFERSARDSICVPMDGRRYRKPNYAWSTAGFQKVDQSLAVTFERSYRSRRLAAQGASRQRNLLAMYEKLAANYARRLDHEALHLVVQQNLLPFLWRAGHLGGRSFDVLMNSLPMAELQARLDLAHSLHPESTTLGDFRADPSLVEAESEALREARHLITPHTEIASLFGPRAKLIDWASPAPRDIPRQMAEKPCIVFPASTVGRKGCYELREALAGLPVTLITLGPYIESPDFWAGFDVVAGGADWIHKADLVVLPAFVEHRPRRLIAAAAAHIPVIASEACGVGNVAGIETVKTGDARELSLSIRRALVPVRRTSEITI